MKATIFWAALLSCFSLGFSGCPNRGASVNPTPVDPSTALSLSITPASSIYPIECNDYSRYGLNIPGTSSLSVSDWYSGQSAERRQVELRGWLVTAEACKGDGDWAYNLEVDPKWADQVGLDLNKLVRVGNVLLAKDEVDPTNLGINFQPSRIPATFYQSVSPPIVHMEIHPWLPKEHPCARSSGQARSYWPVFCYQLPNPDISPPPGAPTPSPPPTPPVPPCTADSPPADWLPESHTQMQGRPSWGAIQCANNTGAFWPYNPMCPVPGQPCLEIGDYVRVVGMLITDDPHLTPPPSYKPVFRSGTRDPKMEIIDVKEAWGGGIYRVSSWVGGTAGRDGAHPGRYTEVHPMDLLTLIDRNRRAEETVAVVAIVTEDTNTQALYANAPVKQVFDLDLSPPGGSGARIVVDEKVDGDVTDVSTITAGNAQRTGARIDIFPNHAHLHIEIEGRYGAKGHFKAVYRVRWQN